MLLLDTNQIFFLICNINSALIIYTENVLGTPVSNIRALHDNFAGNNARVVIPVVGHIVAAIAIDPGSQESRILVRDEHLASQGPVGQISLEANGHLISPVAVQRFDDINIVIQVDSTVLRENGNAPVVAAMMG